MFADSQAILNTCTQVVRSYRSSNSFTRRIYDDSSRSITDPWHTLVQDEETWMQNEKIAQVRLIITRSFTELPDFAQKALKLWFGLGLTQSDILIVLGRLLGSPCKESLSSGLKLLWTLLLVYVTSNVPLAKVINLTPLLIKEFHRYFQTRLHPIEGYC